MRTCLAIAYITYCRACGSGEAVAWSVILLSPCDFARVVQLAVGTSHRTNRIPGASEKGFGKAPHPNAIAFEHSSILAFQPRARVCVIDKIMHAIIESWPSAVFIGSSVADLFIHWALYFFLSIRLWYCYMKIGPRSLLQAPSFCVFPPE